MTKELISTWFSKISESEKGLPLLIVDGIAYTPRVAYEEAIRGSPLGNKLQSLVESGKFGTTAEQELIVAKARVVQWLSQDPNPDKIKFVTMSNKQFTARQLLQEVQSGTVIGRQWVVNEVGVMRRIVSVR